MKFVFSSLFKKTVKKGSYLADSTKCLSKYQKFQIISFSKDLESLPIKSKNFFKLSTDGDIDPTDLEQILYESDSFMKTNTNTLIIIKDINLLLEANPFEKVLHFILNLKDLTSSKDATLIVIYNKELIQKKHLIIFSQELKKI
ncbi:MAG: DUF835 domain-containing protein [Nanoarchaeota archaeon]|nr:DUF835 domain-containing protein [Nanoarchaeota archaeon]